MIAEADEVRLVRDGRGELALALGERNRSQVAPVGERQVEHVVHDRGIGPGVERVLQRLEARAAVLAVHGDLAVEPGAPESELRDRAREVRELSRPVLTAAREEPHVAAVDAREHAVAVVLDLVEPLLAGRRRSGKGRELRRDECGQPGRLRAPRARRRGDLRRTLHALRRCYRDVRLAPGARARIARLDQQPVAPGLVPATGAHEPPPAVELLAVEPEREPALRERARCILVGGPRALVPQHDLAGTVLPGGNNPFEVAVLERMVLDLDGEPLLRRVERRPLRHRPATQRTIQLEAEVVVQAGGGVALDEEPGCAPRIAALARPRLRRAREVALGDVPAQPHLPGALRCHGAKPASAGARPRPSGANAARDGARRHDAVGARHCSPCPAACGRDCASTST